MGKKKSDMMQDSDSRWEFRKRSGFTGREKNTWFGRCAIVFMCF